MAAPGKIAGLSSFFVDGVPVTAMGALEYKPYTTVREPKIGMDGTLVGWKETGDPAYMAVTLYAMPGMRIADMVGQTNVQLVAKLANGLTVTGYSMTQMEAVPVDSDEATFKMKWIGPSVVEA